MDASTAIAITILLALAAYTIWFKSFTRSLNGPRVWPLLGSLPGFIQHANRMHDWVTENLRACGGTYSTCSCVIPFIAKKQAHITITCDPKNIEHILKLRFHNYPKGPTWHTVFHDLLGNGIVNSDGDTWRAQRKTAAPIFTNQKLRQFLARWVNPIIKHRFWPILAAAQMNHEPVDFQDLLLRLNFDNICGLTLGQDPQTLSPDLPENKFAMAFDEATETSLQRVVWPKIVWRVKKWLRLGMEAKMERNLSCIAQHLSDIINARKRELLNTQTHEEEEEKEEDDDILSRFMNKKDFSSDDFLKHVALNFILAGRDTSSVGLSWFFWLCFNNPNVEEKILVELCAVLMETRGSDVSGWVAEPLTFEEVGRLVYLKAAILEMLRLYPPVPTDIKYVVNDDVLPSGMFVPAGSKVSYSIYSIGRMEFVWGHDCLEFRPERWLSADGNKIEAQDPYKFASFNAGPRICLGKDLAFLQMQSIAAAVLLRHRLSVVPGHRVEQKMSLTLFMKYGLRVTVHSRDLRPILDHVNVTASSYGINARSSNCRLCLA